MTSFREALGEVVRDPVCSLQRLLVTSFSEALGEVVRDPVCSL